jgi:hypothetical protein
MFKAFCLMASFALLASVTTAEEKAPSLVREVVFQAPLAGKDRGDVTKPMKITSAEELKKAFGDNVDKVASKTDFSKEYLLLFKWAGSGGDKLTASTEKKAVVFTLKRGMTKDLKMHAHLFAIAKDVEWSLSK